MYEAPSSDALLKFIMEPECAAVSAFETVEVKMAISNEEIARMLKQAKIALTKNPFLFS